MIVALFPFEAESQTPTRDVYVSKKRTDASLQISVTVNDLDDTTRAISDAVDISALTASGDSIYIGFSMKNAGVVTTDSAIVLVYRFFSDDVQAILIDTIFAYGKGYTNRLVGTYGKTNYLKFAIRGINTAKSDREFNMILLNPASRPPTLNLREQLPSGVFRYNQ